MIWTRMSAAGNTFFVADSMRGQHNPQVDKMQLTRNLCHGLKNVPTDGLLMLEKASGYDFKWDFYNADGSRADMCGNAARCASLYYFNKVSSKNHLRFLTGAGGIESWIEATNRVRVSMPAVKTLSLPGGFSVDTGVPHIVLAQSANLELARELRKNNANVTFVSEIKNEKCVAVTFERGVENFTAACGTGAVAAAVYMADSLGLANGLFEITMPGGKLQVDYQGIGQRPLLSGDAQFDFEVETF